MIIAAVCVLCAGCSSGSNNAGPAANIAGNNAAGNNAPIADGTYSVKFDSDGSMFHINEVYKGRGILTVKNGEMTVHIVMPSKKIVNLFYGKAADAKKQGAKLIEPVTENVTYPDGITEETYAFDIPVPYLDKEFDCAIIGNHENWYDHKVIVSDPQPIQ